MKIEILKSRKIIGRVIDTLNLKYFLLSTRKVKKQSKLYKKNNPILFQLIDINPLLSEKDTTFVISITGKK